MKTGWVIASIVLVAAAMVGCATMPQTTPELEQARQEYRQAQDDPTISRFAPVPLNEAAQALEMAENAESRAARDHHIFMARNKIELARTLAAEDAAEQKAEELQAQKDDLLLRVRAAEAEQARQQALQAEEQALQAEEQIRAYQREQREQELMQAQQAAEQARAEIEQLKQEIQDLEAEQTERGILLTFDRVLFETDKAKLEPGAELAARKLADFLQAHPERPILIEGHTDSQGPAEYNQRLSQQRAQAVADVLQTEGVRADRMTVRGLGEEYPIAPNTTPAGRQENRRVEILIQNRQQTGAAERGGNGS